MAVVIPGGYTGASRHSRAPDLSNLSNVIAANQERKDQLQLNRIAEYGIPGLAYLAGQGDQQAVRTLRRYGITDWQRYVPDISFDKDGNPSTQMPKGVEWDPEQRHRFGIAMFGFKFAEAEAAEAAQVAAEDFEPEASEARQEAPKPGQVAGPLPEPEAPAAAAPEHHIPQEPTEVRDEAPEAKPEAKPEDRAAGPRTVASMQGDPTIHPGADFAERQDAQKMTAILNQWRTYGGNRQTMLDPRTAAGRNWAALAQRYGEDPIALFDMIDGMVGQQRSTGSILEQHMADIDAEVEAANAGLPGPTGPSPLNIQPPPPGTGSAVPQQQAPGVSPITPRPGGFQFGPAGEGTQSPYPSDAQSQHISEPLYGNMASAGVSDTGRIFIDTENMQPTGEPQEVGIALSPDPETGFVRTALVVGDEEVEIQTEAQAKIAELVSEAIKSPESPKAKAAAGAITAAARQTSEVTRNYLSEEMPRRMVPAETYSRAVHDWIRTDPQGASAYFQQSVERFLSSGLTMAETELRSAQAAQTREAAEGMRIHNEAIRALGPEFAQRKAELELKEAEARLKAQKISLEMAGRQLDVWDALQEQDYHVKAALAELGLTQLQLDIGSFQLELQAFQQAFLDSLEGEAALQFGASLFGLGGSGAEQLELLIKLLNTDWAKEHGDAAQLILNQVMLGVTGAQLGQVRSGIFGWRRQWELQAPGGMQTGAPEQPRDSDQATELLGDYTR